MDSRLALPQNTILDGSYRIERVVGVGGFGITYEAEDLNLGTMVAIKEYYPFDFGDRDAAMSVQPKSDLCKRTFEWGRSNFLQEARTLARFEHPNIVRVTRVFEANSTAYMVMRFEQGRNFEAWLTSLGRPPTQDELDAITAAVLRALETMHAANFLHRDIAPDNIIVRADGSPVLLDFGAARRAVAEMSQSVTGIVKPGYSPHEQYSSDSRLQGPWSDFYALGGTLYRAIAGRPPEEATLRVDVDRMPPAAQVAKGRYRPDFLEGIDACLKVKQAERPQSVAQLEPMLLGPQAAGNARPVARRRFAAAAAILLAVGVAYGGLEYTRWAPAERGGEFAGDGPRNAARDEVQRAPALEQEKQSEAASAAAKRQADLDADRRRTEDERSLADAEARRKEAAAAAQREAESEAARRREEEAQRTASIVEEEKKASERQSLTRSLQTALGKVGCYPGNVTGQWDAEGRAALAQFAKRAKVDLAVDEPTIAALTAVLVRTDRVCPLECDGDKVESNGKCVPKANHPEPGAKAPSSDRERPARASAQRGYDPSDRSRRVTAGGHVTCGRNGCQTVPKGCHAVRGGGGGGMGGKIICP